MFQNQFDFDGAIHGSPCLSVEATNVTNKIFYFVIFLG